MGAYEVRTDPLRIHAPAEVVWDVLTDVGNYGRWNPFTPRVSTDFAIGSPIKLTRPKRLKEIVIHPLYRPFEMIVTGIVSGVIAILLTRQGS